MVVCAAPHAAASGGQASRVALQGGSPLSAISLVWLPMYEGRAPCPCSATCGVGPRELVGALFVELDQEHPFVEDYEMGQGVRIWKPWQL